MVPVAIDEPPSIELYGFLTVDVNTRLELSAGDRARRIRSGDFVTCALLT